jgi:hypothetical protein
MKEAVMANQSLVRELWGFLKIRKKYWLIPVIALLLVLGLIIGVGVSSAAPFIYTLF